MGSERPASTRLRCPKCRCGYLELTETIECTTTFIVSAGRLDRSQGFHEPGCATGVHGQCRACGHFWRVRKAIQITDVVVEDREVAATRAALPQEDGR